MVKHVVLAVTLILLLSPHFVSGSNHTTDFGIGVYGTHVEEPTRPGGYRTNATSGDPDEHGTISETGPYETWLVESELPGNYDDGVRLAMTVVVDDTVYVLGGWTQAEKDTTTVWAYDTNDQVWEQKSSMLTAASGVGAVHANGSIYVAGSFSDPVLQIYDIATDTWTYGAGLPEGRFDVGMVEHESRIYLIGGGSSVTLDSTNTTFIYDIATDSWSSGADMPRTRQGVYGSALIDGKIYLVGGNDVAWGFPLELDIYDIATDTWSQGVGLDQGVSYHGLVARGSDLYVLGGLDESWAFIDTVLEYDTTSDSWSAAGSYPFPDSETGFAADEYTIYGAGGTDDTWAQRDQLLAYRFEPPAGPSVTIHSPLNTTYPNESITLNLTTNVENATITYSLNETNVTYTAPHNVTLAHGTHTLFAWIDVNGTITRSNVTFSIDTSAPELKDPLIEPRAVILGSNVTLNATTNDTLIITVSHPNGSTVELNGSYTYTPPLGRTNVTMYAKDSFNRTSEIFNGSFTTYEAVNITIRTIDRSGASIASSASASYLSSVIATSENDSGTHVFTLANTTIELSVESDEMRATFSGYPQDLNVTFDTYVMRTYDYTYALDAAGYTNAQVQLSYDHLVADDDLFLYRCDAYVPATRTCGSWTDVTSSSTNDASERTFTAQTDLPAAYSISIGALRSASNPSSSRSRSSGSGSSGGGFSVSSSACESGWECTDWSACIEGERTRTCTLINDACEPVDERPAQTQECSVAEPATERPEQLFDIRMTLAEQVLAPTDPIVATTRFESFGQIPTPVNLTYRVLQGTRTIHEREERIVVESELTETERFEGLELEPGSYTFILTTVYGDGIEDDFRQSFTITAPPAERSVPAVLWAVLVLAVLLAVLTLASRYGRHRS